MRIRFLTVLMMFAPWVAAFASGGVVTVDCASEGGPLRPFWVGTGFSPAELLLEPAMQQQMQYMGAAHAPGTCHVWLGRTLDLVGVQVRPDGQVGCDWTLLDRALDVLVDNGLVPCLVLQGNPSRAFRDLSDPQQAAWWAQMIEDLTRHLADRFAVPSVKSWLFVTWPDPEGRYFGGGPEDRVLGDRLTSDEACSETNLAAYLAYYRACREGLDRAGLNLRLGAPGTDRIESPLLNALFECWADPASRPDVLVFGSSGGKARQTIQPNLDEAFGRAERFMVFLRRRYPKLADLPFVMAPCDPLTGWREPVPWRGEAYFAALRARMVAHHQRAAREGAGLPLAHLITDHAWPGGWFQRSQFAFFETVRGFDLIKKPVHHAETMLGLLEGRWLPVRGLGSKWSGLGVMAVRRSDAQIAVLLYNCPEDVRARGDSEFRLRLEQLPFEKAFLVRYRLDHLHGNAHRVWDRLGRPQPPTGDQIRLMRRFQELSRHGEVIRLEPREGVVELSMEQPVPSIELLLVCCDPGNPPQPPSDLRAVRYAGVEGEPRVMLHWDGPGLSAVKTYEIQWSAGGDAPFKRINRLDQVTPAFLDDRSRAGAAGVYRVRAVDFQGRASEFSTPRQVDPAEPARSESTRTTPDHP